MISSMSTRPSEALPIEGAVVQRAVPDDAPELLVLQRCCWVDEAIANDTLDIPALHETLADVRDWLGTWTTWCVRNDGRLIGAVRAHQEGPSWEIGRLMVAPDLAGQGLGGWLLRLAEAHAPADVDSITLFTGSASVRNIAMYERAGFRHTPAAATQGVVRLVKHRDPDRPGLAPTDRTVSRD
jgi:ribosomal protein S18 acetylase RimI-like enzyme